MKPTIDTRLFIIKYSLEFFVVVLGISVSFWLSEWNEQRKFANLNIEDAYDLLEDLAQDEERLEFIEDQIDLGLNNAHRLLANIELSRTDNITYSALTDSLIDIGYLYVYGTFFINNGSYKSLLQNCRIQSFPSEIEKHLKGYYEYVSKRVADNNRLVDNITVDYYANYHPFCLRGSIGALPMTDENKREFFRQPDTKENYLDVKFYNASLNFRSRISMHKTQIRTYQQMREKVQSMLLTYVEENK